MTCASCGPNQDTNDISCCTPLCAGFEAPQQLKFHCLGLFSHVTEVNTTTEVEGGTSQVFSKCEKSLNYVKCDARGTHLRHFHRLNDLQAFCLLVQINKHNPTLEEGMQDQGPEPPDHTFLVHL